MSKRIFLYGGAIVWTLVLFILLSDRLVTDAIPVLESKLVRFVVVFAVNIAVGSLVRALIVRRSARTATS